MKTQLWKRGLPSLVAALAMTLFVPASAQVHGAPPAGPHGAPGAPGGGWHGGWHGGGPGWWGWGLGFGLGWDAAMLGYPWPYYGYYYEPYPYEGWPAVPPEYAAPSPPPPQWFYCDSAKAYYPQVTHCPEGWRAVTAVPPPPAAGGR